MHLDMLKQRWVSQEETVFMLDMVCLHHLDDDFLNVIADRTYTKAKHSLAPEASTKKFEEQ